MELIREKNYFIEFYYVLLIMFMPFITLPYCVFQIINILIKKSWI
jgi:hypothetical protein